MNTDLKSYIDRQVSLMEEAEANREDQKTLAAEIKDDGFTPATVKKLAALIISDKKARKAKALNEEMALYIREAGLHLDLGYETTVAEIVTQRTADPTPVSAPEATAGGGKPAVAETIPKSEAGASTREDDVIASDGGPASPASDTPSPKSSAAAAPVDPLPDAETLPPTVALDNPDDAGWEKSDSAGNHAEVVRAIRAGVEQHGPEWAMPSALRQRLESAINELGADPQVADIARRTLALYESGDIHGAAIIVDAVNRGAQYPALPAGLDRRDGAKRPGVAT